MAKSIPTDDTPGIQTTPGAFDHLAQQAREAGSVRVIARLKVDYQPEGKLSGTQAVTAQRETIKRSQNALLQRLGARPLSQVKRFQFVPYLAFSIDEEGLAFLETLPEVAAVEEDIPVPAGLAESVPLIGATPAQTGGFTGAGQAVVILDTGVDKVHPFLAGKVVSEACYSSNDSAYGATTACPDGSEASTAAGSGVNCSFTSGCNHGTHVAGIAAGKGALFSGVAPDASIIAIQVFSRFDSVTYCSGQTSPCVMSFPSDQLLALERVYALSSQYNIAAVNMSLGGAAYSSYCDSSNMAMKAAIDNLRSAGVATVISSGNEGSTTGIATPACISSAISVGSTTDGGAGGTPVDTVSSFSNSASFLSLLAPGQAIYSSIPGGGYATYQGTSMASPHVTGAWAVLKSKYPKATVDQVLTMMTQTGALIQDTRNGVIKPRIKVNAALAFQTGNPPAISGFSPYSGPAGTAVEIYGTNLGKATTLKFNNVAATSLEIVSDTHIRAVVPASATTGKVSVISPSGTGSSVSSFQVGANTISYTLISTGIAPTKGGATAWADYNNDGKLDVLVTGEDAGTSVTRLYRGDGNGGFTLVPTNLPGSAHGEVAWADVDNDGDLDLLLSGTGPEYFTTRMFLNQNGTFTEDFVGFLSGTNMAVDFGDYDNDGDLDLALSGRSGTYDEMKIYRNDGGGEFTSITFAQLVGVNRGAINWVDYDNDGDLDLFADGQVGTSQTAVIHQNGENLAPGMFAPAPAGVTYVYDGSADWGDFDNDGDLDVLLTGVYNSIFQTRLFRNNGSGTFTEVAMSAPPAVSTGTGAFGDYDNDGDLDILISGSNGDIPVAVIYKNQSGAFTQAYVPIHGIRNGQAAWGDYDNDQDLDLLLVGDTLAGSQAFLYRNESQTANTPPAVPGALSYNDAGTVTLKWDPASDSQTPTAGLSYSLRVGRTPGAVDIIAPDADLSSGIRRLPAIGNMGQGTSAIIKGLPYGIYYWTVQAIDASYAGSPFAAEQRFTVAPKVAFKNAAERVDEFTAFPQFVVTLETPQTTPVTVDYATQSHTAIAGTDFMPASGTLTFAPGQTSQSFSVEIINDGLSEDDKAFFLNLSNPSSNVHLGINKQSIVTIADDDGFVESGVVLLPSSYDQSGTWGDYDNDGSLDFVMSGFTNAQVVTRIYHNNKGSFTDINAGLPGADYTYFEWFDYDLDGDLDLLYYGRAAYGSYFTRIYRNTSGTFTDINAGLPGYDWEYVTLADFDNDGDQDLLMLSTSGTFLYQNNAGKFSVVTSSIAAAETGPAAWGDYDNDGDLDLALTGYVPNSYYTYITRVYRNNGNSTFTDINAGMIGVYGGTAAWGDYDNDGYLDLLITGNSGSTTGYVSKIYHNNGNNTFTDIQAGLPGAGDNIDMSSWGDFDNDGDLDILLAGIPVSPKPETRVYRNEGNGVFVDIYTNIKGSNWAPTSWGDYDNDTDLDLILVDSSSLSQAGYIYQNRETRKNTAPSTPTNLRAAVNGTSVTLSWDAARDDQTPTSGLSYNVRVGTYPGGDNVLSPVSNKTTGYRSVPQMGNANLRTFAVLNNLSIGMTYYWSVQAVDTAFAGSPFAVEGSFGVSLPSVAFGSPVTVSESQPGASVTVQLSNASSRAITVQYAASNGTAASGVDYQSIKGQLTFNAGETVKTVTVPILEDTLDENDETIQLTLSSPVNATLGTVTTVDITIQDNDAPPTVQLSANQINASEGDGVVTLTAALSTASGKTVTVSYNTSSGTASAGSDYTSAGGQLTFGPGEISKTVSVPILDDALDEPAETFFVNLSAPGNASIGTPARSTVTINDNNSPVQARFGSASYAISENQGQAVVTVQLSQASGWTVQVHYAAAGGTAAAGSDFTPTEGDFSFAPGETSKNFSIPVIDDSLYEGDESVNLTLTGLVNASAGTPVTAQLVIRDNEPAPLLRFGASSYTAVEKDGAVTVTVTLSAPSGAPASVAYDTVDLTGRAGIDYAAASGTLAFPAGTISRSFTVSLMDDSLDNDDQTVNLILSNPSGAALAAVPTSAVLTIQDDDPAPAVQFDPSTVQMLEGAGTAALTARLSAASKKTITVDYRTANGSAQAGSDYQAANGSIIFNPGETVKTVTISILEDILDEDEETFQLTLANPLNASLETNSTVGITIVDNDAAPTVRLAAETASVSESDGQVRVTVILSAASGRVVTVNYDTTDSTASAGSDYSATSGQLTFAPGTTSQTIAIPVLDDALDEPAETFLLDLCAPTHACAGVPSQEIITINDNDAAVQVSFSSASYEISEDKPQAVIYVQLSQPSGWTVQAHYAVRSGTATGGTSGVGNDFILTEGDLSFAPGETSKTINVPIIDDSAIEGPETASLALSGLVNAESGTLTDSQLIIYDNELPPVARFSAASYTAAEKDGTVMVTVTLLSTSALPAEVTYSTADLTAQAGVDYTVTSGRLIFPAGTTSQSFTVTLLDDSKDNEDKTIQLTLSNPSGATLSAGSATAVLTIQDDDPAPTVQFATSSAQSQEGDGKLNLAVKLSAASEKPITVSYYVVGGTATVGEDLIGGEGTLTFAPGETTQALELTLLDDAQLEPGESILLALFGPSNATIGQTAQIELRIVDNESPFNNLFLPALHRVD